MTTREQKLIEALQPFAEAAKHCRHTWDKGMPIQEFMFKEQQPTFGDLLRAREILASLSPNPMETPPMPKPETDDLVREALDEAACYYDERGIGEPGPLLIRLANHIEALKHKLAARKGEPIMETPPSKAPSTEDDGRLKSPYGGASATTSELMLQHAIKECRERASKEGGLALWSQPAPSPPKPEAVDLNDIISWLRQIDCTRMADRIEALQRELAAMKRENAELLNKLSLKIYGHPVSEELRAELAAAKEQLLVLKYSIDGMNADAPDESATKQLCAIHMRILALANSPPFYPTEAHEICRPLLVAITAHDKELKALQLEVKQWREAFKRTCNDVKSIRDERNEAERRLTELQETLKELEHTKAEFAKWKSLCDQEHENNALLERDLASVRERTIEECVALINKMISDWSSNKDVQSVLASVAFGIRALAKPAAEEKVCSICGQHTGPHIGACNEPLCSQCLSGIADV